MVGKIGGEESVGADGCEEVDVGNMYEGIYDIGYVSSVVVDVEARRVGRAVSEGSAVGG